MESTNFDRIDAYLFGQLPAAEAESFERDIAADPALAAEVAQQRLEHRAMELLHQADLRAQMAAWKAEAAAGQSIPAAQDTPPLQARVSRRTLLLRLAAAASVLLLVGFFSRQLFFKANPERLAMTYLDETGYTPRSRGSESTPLEAAYAAMDVKDYPTALNALNAIQDGPYREAALLLGAECRLRLKDYSAADALRALAANSTDPENREKAEWLLALTLTARNDKSGEAARLLDKIGNDGGHRYSVQALTLAKELK